MAIALFNTSYQVLNTMLLYGFVVKSFFRSSRVIIYSEYSYYTRMFMYYDTLRSTKHYAYGWLGPRIGFEAETGHGERKLCSPIIDASCTILLLFALLQLFYFFFFFSSLILFELLLRPVASSVQHSSTPLQEVGTTACSSVLVLASLTFCLPSHPRIPFVCICFIFCAVVLVVLVGVLYSPRTRGTICLYS